MKCGATGLIITLACSILLAPLAAAAQPMGKVHRIGWLSPGSPLPWSSEKQP
jgi:hypothetical protein